MHGRSGMSDMLVSREDFISNHWAAHQEGPVFFCFFISYFSRHQKVP